MTNNRYLIWLEWPEKCFRMNAEAFRYFQSLVPVGSRVVVAHTERSFLRQLPQATHAVVWNFRREWFDIAKKLRVLATPAAGRELVPTTGPAGVKIHFGGYHGEIMAETVLAFIMAWSRGFFRPETRQTWPRVELSDKCTDVAGTRAVMVGYGKVGRAIGAKLSLMGVEVIGFGRRNISELPKVAKSADWFIMALPSDTGTDDFLDARMIRHLSRKCVVVNVGRGNAIDEAALFSALRTHRLAGAFLDVRRREPAVSKPKDLPSLVTMPHSSAFSPRYLKLCFRELKDEGLI